MAATPAGKLARLCLVAGLVALSASARADEPGAALPAPSALVAPAPPDQPPPLAQVDFIPERPNLAYRVTIGPTACEAPCTFTLRSGPTRIAVSGLRTFERTLALPPEPSSVVVERPTVARAITGGILTLIGVGCTVPGSWFVAYNNDTSRFIGIILLVVGISHGIPGIVKLAQLHSDRLRLVPTPGFTANRSSGGASLAWVF